ncbi:hypothetical protein [Serinicoccus kebangsaanensis]|uniref:hypothetical protein n=1 Tax=Serinicoccus kebangsaanensis TaxID=2602069 RepID=UPI00124C403B|nr:hypothetical protein [Serinicoccus kebangsaanensis]
MQPPDARQDQPAPEHQPPPGVDDATVQALGKLSEALETVEHARGLLYGFHRLTGSADLALGEAIDQLHRAGHEQLADQLREDLLGRNVLQGRWTFQLVEEYDDGYWSRFRTWEERARQQLAQGRRHLHEARMKEEERTDGRPGHEARPDQGA